MKYTIQFDTNDEDFDYTDLYRTTDSLTLARVLSEVRDKVRGWEKYDPREDLPKQEVCDTLWNILEDVNFERIGF